MTCGCMRWWTDRTGNERAGCKGQAERLGISESAPSETEKKTGIPMG